MSCSRALFTFLQRGDGVLSILCVVAEDVRIVEHCSRMYSLSLRTCAKYWQNTGGRNIKKWSSKTGSPRHYTQYNSSFSSSSQCSYSRRQSSCRRLLSNRIIRGGNHASNRMLFSSESSSDGAANPALIPMSEEVPGYVSFSLHLADFVCFLLAVG